ncbi:GAF domain-containing protein [Ancylomarina longa]|uniref:GAF domain-containing protein n=1 Tax=Ancylomarina longa TaxID=2487017 RepID=A0A434AX91_9BACT|nr:GAF domain-containing protein [Ancylomarina longa]RUT79155.1 GAF domain-containing protein [Ancylomarina longa]
MKLNQLKLNIEKIPFKKSLSFVPLINRLKGEREQGGIKGAQAANMLEIVEKCPALSNASFNVKDVKKYEEEIHLLMSNFFTPSQYETSMGVAATPFDDENFYFTPAYSAIIKDDTKELELVEQQNQINCYKTFTMLVYAYWLIFKKLYGFEMTMDYLFLNRLTDKLNGLVRYYKLEFDQTCVDISYAGKLPDITHDQIYQMINDPLNMDFWLETLPLDNFTFSGFLTFRYVDITQVEVISSLKSQLLEKSAIINRGNFKSLEESIRSLLGLPNLNLGIIALSVNNEEVENRSGFWHGFLNSDQYKCKDYKDTIYEEAARSGTPVLINDLSDKKSLAPIEKALLNKGIKNISIIPLHIDDQLVGIMELGSTKAYDINFTKLRIIKDIIPVFSIALQRTSEELTNRIEAIIKEECTAIHPSVEWRFQKAAAQLLIKRDAGIAAHMEEIVFSGVYPLYGAIDVRHSSVIRNKTIQDDLIEQLELAAKVLKEAVKVNEMPIYDQLIYKLNFFINSIKEGLSSGDEVNVLNFIRHDIESLFSHFIGNNEGLQKAIKEYNSNIDSELNIVYKRRKDFEDSLGMINDCVTSYLEKEEEKAQLMFPHYFEKYRTDGVEYNAYVGGSITENRTFDRIYLKNLRLWQLIISVELARKTEQLKSSLPISLDTASLILVHSQSLAIRFRQDEKKFDVDGAYNIRYEIVKKRIDKAKIKETNERLTQPGKLAIIFSQESDRNEYNRYIEYLIAKDYFESEIEHLVLEDLQGVYGLQAIRVQIKNGKESQDALSIAKEINKLGMPDSVN